MSLLNTQNFLARLYTDEVLRREFLSAPEKIGQENDLSERELAELAEVFPDELNSFADSLRWKRLREVEKLLPLTRAQLNKEFERHFRDFARNFYSQSIKKHLDDALRFCDYLQTDRTVSETAKNAAKYEQAKLEFRALNRRVVARLLDFDVTTGERKKRLAVWLRVGKKEFVF